MPEKCCGTCEGCEYLRSDSWNVGDDEFARGVRVRISKGGKQQLVPHMFLATVHGIVWFECGHPDSPKGETIGSFFEPLPPIPAYCPIQKREE